MQSNTIGETHFFRDFMTNYPDAVFLKNYTILTFYPNR